MTMPTSATLRPFCQRTPGHMITLIRPSRIAQKIHQFSAGKGANATRRSSTMRAVVFDGKGASVDPHRQVPKLRDDSVLVRPIAVALNPTDWKHIRFKRAKPGCIVGCDYAGVVEAVGIAVEKKWKPGDKIFGCAHGSNLVNPDDGVFAEWALASGDLQMRMPDGLSFEQAATLGLGTITVGQGLYQKAMRLDLPSASPEKQKENVLIYGGGTATAALGIQFARHCSPANYDYVKSLGVDLALDFREDNVGAKIREYTSNKLRFAWDTIGTPATAQICADALTTESNLKPSYGSVNPAPCPRSDVKSTSTIMHTVFGKAFEFGPRHMPASAEDYEFGKKFYSIAEELFAKGLVKPHHHIIGKGGLGGIPQGLKDLEDGKVRGKKIVFLVEQ